MCVNEDQFTLANDVCLLELIKVALGHLDELHKTEKYPLGGRYRQVSLYSVLSYGVRFINVYAVEWHVCWVFYLTLSRKR